MSNICQICGKKPHAWNNRSHSMRATRRWFKPNIINKKIDLWEGFKIRVKICSRCYKKFVAQGQI